MKVQVIQTSPSYKRLRTYKREQRRHNLLGIAVVFAICFLVFAAILGGWHV